MSALRAEVEAQDGSESATMRGAQNARGHHVVRLTSGSDPKYG